MNRAVNDRQLEVLRWIADGCPDRPWLDESHKHSARALQNRGLARVSRSSGRWVASITDAGAHYLRHGDYPKPLKAQPAPRRRVAQAKSAQEPSLSAPVVFADPLGPAKPSDAERLYLRIVAADGRLEIANNESGAAAAQLQKAGLAPTGKLLRSKNRGWHHQVLYFVDDPRVVVPTRDVAVPARLAKPHPVAQQYRDDADHHEVSTAHLARAVRIVHALATAFDDLGLPLRYEVGRTPDGQFKVRSGAWGESLRVSEKSAPGGDPQPYYGLRRGKPLPAWQSRRQKQFISTGTLSIQVGIAYGSRGGRQQRFSDARGRTLEDVLANVVREIEMRFLERHQDDAESQHQEREQEARWQRVLADAEARAIEEHRAAVLRARASAWRTWESERDYVNALATRLSEVPDPDRPRIAEWITWSRERLAATDPLLARHLMPANPEPTKEFLEPHIRGWAAHFRRFWA